MNYVNMYYLLADLFLQNKAIIILFFYFFQYHERDCQFILIDCRHDNCEMKVQRGLMDSHANERCPFRSIKCENCKEVVVYKDLEVQLFL